MQNKTVKISVLQIYLSRLGCSQWKYILANLHNGNVWVTIVRYFTHLIPGHHPSLHHQIRLPEKILLHMVGLVQFHNPRSVLQSNSYINHSNHNLWILQLVFFHQYLPILFMFMLFLSKGPGDREKFRKQICFLKQSLSSCLLYTLTFTQIGGDFCSSPGVFSRTSASVYSAFK